MSKADQNHDVTSRADEGKSSDNADMNPMEGGPWRPVRPDELLRKNPPDPNQVEQPKPKVRLERRQELEHHLRASPTDLEAFQELARIYRAEERPMEARRILEQAMRIFPDNTELLWEFEEATLARSLQQYREVTELAERLGTAETDRELKRSRSDWAGRRMDVCRARLERDPSLVQLRLVMAEAMVDAEMYELAQQELEPLFENDELAPQAHLLVGKCLLELGNDVEAMVHLRAASVRRAIVAPPKVRITALKLLCDTAERLGIQLTLDHYRQHLRHAEQELAKRELASQSTPGV